MANEHQVADIPCIEPGCEATYKAHRWGRSQASEKGWFTKRNGDAWCPDHLPDWVAGWRARSKS